MENGAECVLKDVTVYEHLDGNAEIASVEDFNIEDYAKRIIPIHYRASLHPDQWKCLKIFHPVSFQMKLTLKRKMHLILLNLFLMKVYLLTIKNR